MKVIATKDEPLMSVVESIGSVVHNKYYYIPGWWEKLDNGDMLFHHLNKLPKELTDAVTALNKQNEEKK